MSVLGFFDHLFVINLPMNEQRMVETEQQLELHKIPFERLDGVISRRHSSPTTNGLIGCLLGHLNAVKTAQKRNYQSVLIAEDDVALRANFNELWSDVAPQMPGLKYDLFYFYNWMRPLPLVRPIRANPIKTTLCSHFYAVHSSFFDRYIAIVERQIALTDPTHLDQLFHAPEVSCVATSYNLAGQRPAFSDIAFDFRNEVCFGPPHSSS